MTMVPLAGFQPDIDPATPGILTDCAGVIPTISGFAADKTGTVMTVAASADCRGAALLAKLDGTTRQLYGTDSAVLEYSGGAWVSRVSGLTGGADYPWQFATFGNVCLATNGAATPQASVASTFSDLVGSASSSYRPAPIGKCLVVAQGFVMLFNTATSSSALGPITAVSITAAGSGYAVGNVLTVAGGSGSGATLTVTSINGSAGVTGVSVSAGGGGYKASDALTVSGGAGSGATFTVSTITATQSVSAGSSADGWFCSGLYDYTAWDPSVTASQSAYGRLLDTPGPIVAAARLGDYVVAYKGSSIYLGSYVGPPVIWSWQQISSRIGALGPLAIVNTGVEHLFWSGDNFWRFDGTRPVEIGFPLRRWWLQDSSATYRYRMVGQYDKANNLARFYYVSNGSAGVLDRCLVFNLNTGKWTRSDRTIAAVCDFVSPGLDYNTYPGAGLSSQTWDTSVSLTYDSPLWNGGDPLPGYVGTDRKVYTLNGTPGQSQLVTGDYGDDNQHTALTRIRGHWLSGPSSATCQAEARPRSGDPYSVSSVSASLNGSKFDLRQQNRWHRARITVQGSFELAGLEFQLTPRGMR